MLNLTFGNYTIKREDKFNVTLTVTRPKQQTHLHKQVVEGNRIEVIGYYSTLESALESLFNRYVLDEGDLGDVQSVLEAISKARTLIESVCSEPFGESNE